MLHLFNSGLFVALQALTENFNSDTHRHHEQANLLLC